MLGSGLGLDSLRRAGAKTSAGGLAELCKEMDKTSRGLQCEVAQRGLQEIRDSIFCGDKEIEADRNINNLPSLILVYDFWILMPPKVDLEREFS